MNNACLQYIYYIVTYYRFTDELLDVDFQEDIAKLTRLADFLRLGLSSNDAAVISLSAKALGRLSKLDGSRTIAYEMCATELRTWLEVLAEKDRYEMKRQAAVTVLAQLASSAPSLFYLNLNRYGQLFLLPVYSSCCLVINSYSDF